MKRTLAIVIIAALLVFISIEASFLFKGSSEQKKTSDPLNVLWAGNYTKDREYWKGQIDKLGTAQAYENFKKDTEGKEFGVAHTLAHIFGELIYDKEGESGITFCDAAFAYGCYHSFFGKAITEHGIDIVPKLDDLCVQRWGPLGLGCPHGIGHGLMGYMGDAGLDNALKVCAALSWKGPFGGCQSGVFMEYNFHTMQSLQGVENREFDAKNPTYPCESVPTAFRQACYYELSPWLSNTFTKGYAKVGAICSTVKDQKNKEACFIGLGNSIAADTGYNIDKSIASCSLLADKSSAIFCRAGAAWAFYAEPTTRDTYTALCEGLSTSEEKTCIEKSKII